MITSPKKLPGLRIKHPILLGPFINYEENKVFFIWLLTLLSNIRLDSECLQWTNFRTIYPKHLRQRKNNFQKLLTGINIGLATAVTILSVTVLVATVLGTFYKIWCQWAFFVRRWHSRDHWHNTSIGLHHPLDGVTNPEYKLLRLFN